MNKHFWILSVFEITFCLSQQEYKIDAQIEPTKGIINVDQFFCFKNVSNISLDTLYLYDWNHAYADTSTPLAGKLAKEFNFKFEKSQPDEKGYTRIQNLRSDQDSSKWQRLEKQKDIIAIHLTRPIQPQDSIIFSASYILKLPADEFTGYGINNNDEITFRNGFLQFVNLGSNGKWNLDSNYGFNDRSTKLSSSKFTICFPQDYNIIPSLKGTLQNGCWQSMDQIQGNLEFYLKKISDFKSFGSSNFEIVTDMADNVDKVNGSIITKRLQKFAEDFFGKLNNQYFLIDSEFYFQNPIVGFDLLLNSLRPIPKEDQYELKAIQVLMRKLVKYKFPENYRQNRWLADGLSHYLFMRYVEIYFPDLRLIGNMAQFSLLSSYEFAQAPFSFKTNLEAAFVYRRNLAQPLLTPNQDLTKYNRKISLRSRSALGIKILEETESKEQVDAFISNLFRSKNHKNLVTIQDHFEMFFEDRAKWFYEGYCTEEELTDYEIRQIRKSNNQLQVELINHTKAQNPLKLSSYSKNKLVSSIWLPGGIEKQRLKFDIREVDKVVLNPEQFVLETNVNNNNILLKNNFTNRDIRFRLFEDIPSSHYATTYLAPNFSYNAYDGILLGMMIHNGFILRQPTTVFFSPQYGVEEMSLCGSFLIRHRSYFQKKKLASISFGFGAESFHFNPDQKYYRFNPQIDATFRPEGLASNKRSVIGLELISLHQENLHKKVLNGTFNSSLTYIYSNSSSSLSRVLGAALQVGDSFTKFSSSYRNRKYYNEGKQYTFRFFFGLLYDQNNSGNFDFGISRVNDYSFKYNFLGRSERSGFFSQQYILAEGGFKSFIPTQNANQWMMSANFSSTLWRDLEVYSDIGVVKNRMQNKRFIYDAGLSINMIQDYLEIYLPLYSNLGWEIDDNSYSSKIRFTFSVQVSDLISLFTRSWF